MGRRNPRKELQKMLNNMAQQARKDQNESTSQADERYYFGIQVGLCSAAQAVQVLLKNKEGEK
jgi:hypothetical protein